MAESQNERKDDAEVGESVPVVEVQRRLSELMNRVAFGGERLVLTRNGKQTAALVSIPDLERLRASDAA